MIPTFSVFLKYLTERKDKKLGNSIKIARYSKKDKDWKWLDKRKIKRKRYKRWKKNMLGNSETYTGNIITKTDMKNQEFVNELNSYKDENNQYPSDWKKWKLGEDGYPTFE